MTELFQVTVKERDTLTGRVLFGVKIINEDAALVTDDFAFAFQLLHECFRAVMMPWAKAKWGTKREDLPPIPDPPPALADEMGPGDMLSESDIFRMCTAFIAEVTWSQDTETLVVTPTHAAWTEQCRVGLDFGTAAYPTNYGQPPKEKRAAPLKPIDRSAPAEASADVSLGFTVRVPKNKNIPDVIPLPDHKSKAYVAVPIEGVTTGTVLTDRAALLAALKYVPVLYTGFGGREEVGTIVEIHDASGKEPTAVGVYNEGDIMHMTCRATLQNISGRAVLAKPRQRIA